MYSENKKVRDEESTEQRVEIEVKEIVAKFQK